MDVIRMGYIHYSIIETSFIDFMLSVGMSLLLSTHHNFKSNIKHCFPNS